MEGQIIGNPRRRSVGAASSRIGSSTFSRLPQVYFNVEFGLSLSPGHIPNSHTIAYQSRGLRDRLANAPQEPPAMPVMAGMPTAYYPQPAATQPAATDPIEVPQPSYSDYYYYQYQHNRGQVRGDMYNPPVQQQQQQHRHGHHYEQTRQYRQPGLPNVPGSSRSPRESRSSSERGHSAPPPASDSRWDRAAGGANSGASAVPQVWKPLPEVPSRFRLGEMDLPWSAGPDADPDDEQLRKMSRTESDDGSSILHPLRSGESRRHSEHERARIVSASFSNNPTVLPLQPPRIDTRKALEVDPRRREELESLSAAMVTVDNGFEGQWWNQGDRANLPVAASSREEEEELRQPQQPQQPQQSQQPQQPQQPQHPPMRLGRTASLGWAVASPLASSSAAAATTPTQGITRSASDYAVSAFSPWSATAVPAIPDFGQPSRQMTVSPMTVADEEYFPAAADTPTSPWNWTNRTLSTRSDELFLTGSRYA